MNKARLLLDKHYIVDGWMLLGLFVIGIVVGLDSAAIMAYYRI